MRIQAPETGAGARRPLDGRVFVITGTLSEPRARLQTRIQNAGGKVTSAISKNTDYLVAGEKAGTKLRKAETLGVEVLDEQGLRALLEDSD
mgnify:CR=1 FL=1